MMEIPYDDEDCRFVKGFNINDINVELERDCLEFFDQYGFIVFTNVFTPEECALTRNSMWDVVEQQSCVDLNRDDRRTWSNLKSTGKYGLSCRGNYYT